MTQVVKHNEQARKEYRFMSGFEMDAREEGIQQGIEQGIHNKVCGKEYNKVNRSVLLKVPVKKLLKRHGF